jgi:hypothetical protein
MTKKFEERRRSTFQMRVDAKFMTDIEDWRARQRPIPSLTEAIKILVAKGLKADCERK